MFRRLKSRETPLGLIGVFIRSSEGWSASDFFSVLNAEEQEFVRLSIAAFCEAKKRPQANSIVNKN
jgi:hypothetical protein